MYSNITKHSQLSQRNNLTHISMLTTYRKLCTDRHANETDERKAEEEKKFKEIGEAYAVLSDTKKRYRYDNGLDIEEGSGGMGQGMDPNQIFSMFFGGADFGGAPPQGFGGFAGAPGGYHSFNVR